MNETDRERLRNLQDRVIAEAKKHGYSDDAALTMFYEGCPTVKQLENNLWPTWEFAMYEVLEDWANN